MLDSFAHLSIWVGKLILFVASYSAALGWICGGLAVIVGFMAIIYRRLRWGAWQVDFLAWTALFTPPPKETPKGDVQVWWTLRILFLAGTTNLLLTLFATSEEIGAYYEAEEYTATYWVLLFPDGTKPKNYRLKAKIHSELADYSSGEDAWSRREYNIEKIYLPNGRAIEFDPYIPESGVSPNKQRRVKDESGKEWDVVLTTEKAE